MNATIVVHVGEPRASVRGGVEMVDYGEGTTYPAYVEAVATAASRTDANGAPISLKLYNVYTYVDLILQTDSIITWNGRTLSALGLSQDLSGASVLWRTECQEVT